jgi:hypothetical protein
MSWSVPKTPTPTSVFAMSAAQSVLAFAKVGSKSKKRNLPASRPSSTTVATPPSTAETA